jgi:hypothetical protein
MLIHKWSVEFVSVWGWKQNPILRLDDFFHRHPLLGYVTVIVMLALNSCHGKYR